MTDALYFADLGADPHTGDIIEITGDEGRHAGAVKRARVGERLFVSDGAGRAVSGLVTHATKSVVTVQADRILQSADPVHQWTIVQALAKGERSDIAVESVTELGARRIYAWQAARSVVRWDARAGSPEKSAKGIVKWQAVARAASKQSRRFRIPEVGYIATSGLVDLIERADLALVAHERATTKLSAIQLPDSGEVVVIIGPEGGISDEEVERFTAHGALMVSLGDAVLRTSSAGIVALAQLQLLAQLQAG